MSTKTNGETMITPGEERELDEHPRSPESKSPTLALPSVERGLDEHPRPVQPAGKALLPGATGQVAVAHNVSTMGARPAPPATGSNGDEDHYVSRIGNYHKGLQHDQFGEVISGSYQSLLDALATPTMANFEAIQLGMNRKLTNPRAGFAKDTEGPDPDSLEMPPPPRVDSAEIAAEAAELYWMALLRDVPFSRFNTDPMVAKAAADLSTFSDIGKLYAAGMVTPQTIFRGFTPGDQVGPYVSQFLLMDIPYGSLTINQRQQTVEPGPDYLTTFEEWLAVQNGTTNVPQDEFEGTRRYIRNMRDLGQYVHVDALYEAYLNACLILLGIGAPADAGNPYNTSTTESGFGTFGGPHVLSLVCEVATRALKAVWYQKWSVHRRLRPEAYGGLVHLKKAGHMGTVKNYPIPQELLDCEALAETHKKYGTYLMPMAFPEGSPTHPAYGAGHATVGGACVTILKAWFDTSWVLPNPVRPTLDGTELIPYLGPGANSLTVGGELDKVAANIALGRSMAGVHWRSDYTESVRLGEHVAICILREQSTLFNEEHSFTLTTFDGQQITIRDGAVWDASGNRLPFDC